MTIADRVVDLITEELSVDQALVVPAARLMEDLGADSLDTVELVMLAEEEFEIEIPDEDTDAIKTVGDAIKYVERRVQGD